MPARNLGPFEFECGRALEDLTVAYETYGAFTGDNAVLVCHALTGSQHVTSAAERSKAAEQASGEAASSPGEEAADCESGQGRGWWDDVVGPGNAIDTNEYFVVCANVPGSCYGTDGPPSEGPDGGPWGADFPAVTVGDWTRAQRRLLDELGVERLHAVVGGSVGGMNALDWARRFPEDVGRVAAIATAPRLDAQLLGLNAVARRAVRSDPDWAGGDYYGDAGGGCDGPYDERTTGNGPVRGLALARQLGHITYLSKASMDRKFGRRAASGDAPASPFPDNDASAFPHRDVESYLDHQSVRFAARFDANSYLYLTRAMEAFDLRAGHGSDADALAAFDGEALVLSVAGDWHFTTEQGAALADAFRESGTPAVHHVVDSDHGHDAFLVEPESVGPPIASLLGDTPRGFAPVHASLFSG